MLVQVFVRIVVCFAALCVSCDQGMDPENLCARGPQLVPAPFLDLRVGESKEVIARRGTPPNCPAFQPRYTWSTSDTTVVRLTTVNDSTVGVTGLRVGNANLDVQLIAPPPPSFGHGQIGVRVTAP